MLTAITLISLLGSTAVGCSSNQAGQPTVLRLAVPWPPGDPVTNNIQEFVDKFNTQANGKYKIELHPGESLVKIADSMDALRTGATEMCGWPIGVFGSLDPIFAAAELPFAVNSIEADAAMTVETMPLYDTVMTKKFNSKPLFTFTCVGLDLMSVKPIKTKAEWKGVLTQAVSPQAAKFIELMGGASVPMPFPDAYQGLQKKVIDATMQSSPMAVMFKLSEVAKYMTRGYCIPASLVVAINLDTYNKMPGDIKSLIVKLGKDAQVSTNAFFVKVASENSKTLTDLGVTVYQLPKAERDVWVQTLKPYTEELLNNIGGDNAAKLRQVIAELDKKYPYQY